MTINAVKITGTSVVMKHLKINCGLYYGLWVTPAGTISSTPHGEVYDFQLLANSPYGTIVDYQIIAGYLPVGLNMNPTTGQITGTSAVSGSVEEFSFTVTVTDSLGRIDTRTFNIELTGSMIVWITPAGEIGPTGVGGPFITNVEAIVTT